MKELEKYKEQLPAISDIQESLNKFLVALDENPTKAEIKINKFADDSEFIPIQIVEDKLNLYFKGLWQTRNFKYNVIVNEIVGDLELGIYHPVLGQWLWRSGTGAVIIQQRAEYEIVDGKRVKKPVEVLNVEKKIANTLTKDMGHLKAACIKNAAKALGRTFGSGLNRGLEDGMYNPTDILTVDQIEKDVKTIESIDDLFVYYNDLPKHIQNNKRVSQVFKLKKIDLEQNGKA